MRFLRLVLLIFVFSLGCFFAMPVVLSEETGYDDFHYEDSVIYEDGKISINYKERPIIDIISDIEGETGIYFNITGDIPDKEITINIKELPLRNGIENAIAKFSAKSYKFNYDAYSEGGSEIESVDIVFSEDTGDSGAIVTSRSLDRPEEESKEPVSQTESAAEETAPLGTEEVKDSGERYVPAGPISAPGSYGTESKTGTQTPPRIMTRSGDYGTEQRDSGSIKYTPPITPRSGDYGTEHSSPSPPSYNPYIYGDENR